MATSDDEGSDDEVIEAAWAFSAALDRHLDTRLHGGGYWVEGSVEAIAAALLLDGWRPPHSHPGAGPTVSEQGRASGTQPTRHDDGS